MCAGYDSKAKNTKQTKGPPVVKVGSDVADAKLGSDAQPNVGSEFGVGSINIEIFFGRAVGVFSAHMYRSEPY